jgi:hypothetical protein
MPDPTQVFDTNQQPGVHGDSVCIQQESQP